MSRRRRPLLAPALRGLLAPAVLIGALVCVSVGVNNLSAGHGEEDLRQLETALRRACVACYAAEGLYPPDLDYLQEHYGLQIDQERYVVHYDVFAGNLMPDITVLELAP